METMKVIIPFDFETTYGWLIFFMYVAINLLIAYFLGRKRQIGYIWSCFFLIFLSILGGLIITLLSPKYYSDSPKRSKGKIIIGWIMAIFFGIQVLLAFPSTASTHGYLLVHIGFFGLGLYLIQIGKGRIPNKSGIQKIPVKDESYAKTDIEKIN